MNHQLLEILEETCYICPYAAKDFSTCSKGSLIHTFPQTEKHLMAFNVLDVRVGIGENNQQVHWGGLCLFNDTLNMLTMWYWWER